jgi:hypothetical protein
MMAACTAPLRGAGDAPGCWQRLIGQRRPRELRVRRIARTVRMLAHRLLSGFVIDPPDPVSS